MASRPGLEECRALLAAADVSDLPGLIKRFQDDPRAGVRAVLESAQGRLDGHRAELRRLRRMAKSQVALHAEGFAVIAGVDEVGLGSLAGPVSAGAVVLPADAFILGLNDSKLLTPERRRELCLHIRERCVGSHVAHVDNVEIDRVGIAAALQMAMRLALEGLLLEVDHVLLDGLAKDLGLPSTPVVDGDAKVACIAAASIVAKVERDAIMDGLHEEYPAYGWAANKGYSTPDHLEAIRSFGLSPLHRRYYAPCALADMPRLF